MSDLLETESNTFAANLTDLVQGCVVDAPRFAVVNASNDKQRRIGPEPFEPGDGSGAGFGFVSLVRKCDEAEQPRLMLKIEFRVSLDSQAEHLAVQQSTFGLWVRPDPQRGPRPVFRIEYDREATSKPLAHIHLHAESVELGWIYGTAGLPLPRMQEIHFPVGGRRFRPTVEEFLGFLNREKLFTDWRPGWNAILNSSLDAWNKRQAQATVRNNPEAAIEQLERMGYQVVAA
ncbi:hypothetical protein [Candidatus Poriferisocius sp.]|uniref:hypothetical protein n=1 Tax=Candidatus Poriferisocius sp. TaxID=3101276 RepID=UPI003B0148A6